METNSELRKENVEDWSLVMQGGVSATYVVRVDRGEKAVISLNTIDHSPVEVVLIFRDDKTNEITGTLHFPVANLLSYGATKRVATIYGEGESPVEQELKRRKDALEKRIREREAALNDGIFSNN